MRSKMSRCFRAARTVLLTMLFVVVIVIVVGCSGEGQKDTIEASFTRKTEEVAKEKVAGVRNIGIGEYAVTLADGRVYTGYVHDIPAKAENLKCLYIRNDHGLMTITAGPKATAVIFFMSPNLCIKTKHFLAAAVWLCYNIRRYTREVDVIFYRFFIDRKYEDNRPQFIAVGGFFTFSRKNQNLHSLTSYI